MMQILFLSNFYPPASRGGYEQWCQEALRGLRSRGHEVIVLASDFGKNRLPDRDPVWVHRSLHLEMELASFRNTIQFFTHRIKAGDVDDLANQIKYLLENPQSCRRLAENGVQTARQRFDLNVMVNNLESYLEQVNAKAHGT
jgi:hypothetical protein